MSDLIRREDAINAIKWYCRDCNNYNGVRCRACNFDDAMGAVDSVLAVDAVETRRGHWIIKSSGAYCSECKGKVRVSDATSYEYWTIQNIKGMKQPRYKICPFCGAHMDGGEKDD